MSKNKLGVADWKTQRRLQAFNLKRKGWKQKDIATALDVTKGAVSQWLTTAAEKGEVALESRPHSGRPPELVWDEKQLIPEFLSHGAEAYGFRGDVWTCPRVRKVIEWEFGVSYHKSHVARLLKELKWTPQLPVERATQRDEVAIAEWRCDVWKEMKKKHVWNIEPLFLWMNRASIFCQRWSELMRRAEKHRSCVFFKPTIICL